MKHWLSLVLFALLSGTAAAAPSLTSILFKDMDEKSHTLADYAGKVVMIVNVASRCGNTPQYKPLEALYQKYSPQGFIVLGFPCNDFRGQEPGTNAEIKQFCTLNYAVTFPLFDKLHVKGLEQHPLYTALTGPEATFPGDVKWNFGKFLIGKDGTVLARFEPKTQPDDPQVIAAIEAALK
ncbi:MAG TPA: glutathione peroxidase [Chthoniobacterales bacterium]